MVAVVSTHEVGERLLRARDEAVGEPREVIMAAMFMRGTEPDAEFLRDVRRRVEAYELAQAQSDHQAWIKSIQIGPSDLRQIRQRLGVTQGEAARLVGVSQNTWARWERGALGIHPARLRDLERLAEKAARVRTR